MNHAQAINTKDLGPSNHEGETCDGELKEVGRPFYGDVFWVRFRCRKCGRLIDTVEGGRHWWNSHAEE